MSNLRTRVAFVGVVAAAASVLAALPGTASAEGDLVAVCSSTNLFGPTFTKEQDTNWMHAAPATAAYPYAFNDAVNLPAAIPTSKLGTLAPKRPFDVQAGKYTLVCNPAGL